MIQAIKIYERWIRGGCSNDRRKCALRGRAKYIINRKRSAGRLFIYFPYRSPKPSTAEGIPYANIWGFRGSYPENKDFGCHVYRDGNMSHRWVSDETAFLNRSISTSSLFHVLLVLFANGRLWESRQYGLM